MIERLAPAPRVVRPLTFAYTRPLSPTDISGITGLLNDEPVRQPNAPTTGVQKFAQRFKNWLKG